MNYITYWKKKVLLLLGLLITYPLSAFASEVVVDTNLGAPFLWSWIGAWVFALAGGFSSLFIKIEEIDKNVRFIYLAKPFMGTFSAIAVAMFLVEDVNAPGPTLVFYSFFVSFCGSPLLQGLLVKLSNTDVFNSLFNYFVKK